MGDTLLFRARETQEPSLSAIESVPILVHKVEPRVVVFCVFLFLFCCGMKICEGFAKAGGSGVFLARALGAV